MTASTPASIIVSKEAITATDAMGTGVSRRVTFSGRMMSGSAFFAERFDFIGVSVAAGGAGVAFNRATVRLYLMSASSFYSCLRSSRNASTSCSSSVLIVTMSACLAFMTRQCRMRRSIIFFSYSDFIAYPTLWLILSIMSLRSFGTVSLFSQHSFNLLNSFTSQYRIFRLIEGFLSVSTSLLLLAVIV